MTHKKMNNVPLERGPDGKLRRLRYGQLACYLVSVPPTGQPEIMITAGQGFVVVKEERARFDPQLLEELCSR